MLILITFINITVIATVVAVHYEALLRTSLILPNLKIRSRSKVIVGIFAAFIAHVVEIWIFGITIYLLIQSGKFGRLIGSDEGDLLDCVYFSFINYTSIGYGDILPDGPIRFLAALEGLIGLMLITWTASFMYNEMRLYWEDK